jgi:Flp pilus assembly protein TadG
MPWRPGCDAGYSVVEVAIVWPVFLLVVMVAVQATLVWHARHVAEAAAQEGLRTARGYGSTAAAGRDAASAYLRRVAPRLVTDPQVTAATSTTATGTTVTVHVHGRVVSLIGLAATSVDEQATGPVELFVAPGAPGAARPPTPLQAIGQVTEWGTDRATGQAAGTTDQ